MDALLLRRHPSRVATSSEPDPAVRAVLPALPVAASVTILVARILPVDFQYQANPLGIVSRTTLARYPVEQEVFWLAMSAVGVAVSTWAIARWLLAIAWTPRVALALEVAGAATLIAALALPPLAAGVAIPAFFMVALALGRRESSVAAPGITREARTPARRRLAAWTFVLLVVALIRVPALCLVVWLFAKRVPDELLVANTWKFFAEAGQHLAWATALGRGELHGRDFFCLYGPLYDWTLVGLWKVLGRSISVWNLYAWFSAAAGGFAVLLLGACLVRRPWTVLLVPFLYRADSTELNLRLGLAVFGLIVLLFGVERGRRIHFAVSGGLAGLSLLYSQEFGLCLLVVAAIALGLRFDLRQALAFFAALASVLGPLLGYYAAHGALTPLMRDLLAYPGYVMAGYGNIAFPSLLASLPLQEAELGSPLLQRLRLGYLGPAVCGAALLLALRVASLDPRRPLASLAALRQELLQDPGRLAVALVATFGLLVFRSALGRSDLTHIAIAFTVPAVLLVVALDRSLGIAWNPGQRILAGWRIAALVGLLVWGGLLDVFGPDVRRSVRSSLHSINLIRSDRMPPSRRTPQLDVWKWIVDHSEPSDPVLFLPNNAAYHYLTERPSPTRFVLSHQLVTDSHREEFLHSLRQRPPRYVVWDDAFMRVDGIGDEVVLGSRTFAWLHANYEFETRFGPVRILRARGGADTR